MTVFTVPGEETKYYYPEVNEDVTLGDYLYYLEKIIPQEPVELSAFRAQWGILQALQEDLNPWLQKAGLAKDCDSEEIAGALREWLSGAGATKKAQMIVPQLLLEWEKAKDNLDQTVDAMDDVWHGVKMLPFMASTVAHFTKLSLNTILGKDGKGMHVKSLEYLYKKIQRAITPREEYEYKQLYIVKGEVYQLPDKLMTNSTVIEFAEAAQFQANAEKMRHGSLISLIDVCAVLLRKPDEAYSDAVYQRNRETFKTLTLAQGMEIAFFLMKQSERYASDFLTSTALQAVHRARALVN